METTLHKQLKALYADETGQTEVRLGRYRIDAINDGRLVEIQHSGLGAIRDKIRSLLDNHEVDVVKPIIERKKLVKLDRRDGNPVSQRWSPAKGTTLQIFDELLHFTRVFPHRRLRLFVPFVIVEETRYPGHGRRRRWRQNDFVVADQQLVEVTSTIELSDRRDLIKLLPGDIQGVFDTAELAQALAVHRSVAQRIAYVLRETGTTKQIGKAGNRLLYRIVEKHASSRRAANSKTNSPRKSA